MEKILQEAKETKTRAEFEKKLEEIEKLNEQTEMERKKREEERKEWEEGRKNRLVVLDFAAKTKDEENELWQELRGRQILLKDSKAQVVKKRTALVEKPIYFIICENEEEVREVEKRRNRSFVPGALHLPFRVFKDRSFAERKNNQRHFLGAGDNRWNANSARGSL